MNRSHAPSPVPQVSIFCCALLVLCYAMLEDLVLPGILASAMGDPESFFREVFFFNSGLVPGFLLGTGLSWMSLRELSISGMATLVVVMTSAMVTAPLMEWEVVVLTAHDAFFYGTGSMAGMLMGKWGRGASSSGRRSTASLGRP